MTTFETAALFTFGFAIMLALGMIYAEVSGATGVAIESLGTTIYESRN